MAVPEDTISTGTLEADYPIVSCGAHELMEQFSSPAVNFTGKGLMWDGRQGPGGGAPHCVRGSEGVWQGGHRQLLPLELRQALPLSAVRPHPRMLKYAQTPHSSAAAWLLLACAVVYRMHV